MKQIVEDLDCYSREIWVCCCCCCCSVHGSSFTLAARGHCRCINGELICAKPQYSSPPQQGNLLLAFSSSRRFFVFADRYRPFRWFG